MLLETITRDRVLIYQVSARETGLKVSTYLRKKGLSRQNLVTLKQDPETVLVSGQPVHFDYRLRQGEMLTLHILEKESSPSIEPVKLPLCILYEDEDIIVLDKPAGMPVHPSFGNHDNSLANGLAWYYQSRGIPFVFRCCNRLDRDTSGVILVAKHWVSAALISAMGTRRVLTREYLAIIKGHPVPPEGTIEAPISRLPGSILKREVDFVKGEYAKTYYSTTAWFGDHSLVRLKLETGRTHQIRVHMKYIGYPLIGDYLYNPDMEKISRQALHSWRLSFPHPLTGEYLVFTAPLPADLQAALENCK